MRKAENLFFTTTFWLIILGGILYSKPIILSIIERGFTPDRGFDLTYGLVFGAIATKKKMEQDHVYTPDGVLGRNKSDVIEQQIAQPTLTITQSESPISQARAIKNALNNVADVAESIAPNDPTVKEIADVIEDPFKALENIKL